MPVSIEQHVEWIAECILAICENGLETIEAAEDATTAGPSTCRRSPTRPSTPRRPPGTWAPTSPASPGSFSPMSEESTTTATAVTPSSPRVRGLRVRRPGRGHARLIAMALDEATSRALWPASPPTAGRPCPICRWRKPGEVFDQMAALSGEGPEMVSGRSTGVSAHRRRHLPLRLLVPRRAARGDRVLPRRRVGDRLPRRGSSRSGGSWRHEPGAPCSWWTTGWRPSTGSPPPSRTRGPPCGGPTSIGWSSPGGRSR